MRYVIAMDSGGTKTDCVLCDTQGRVLRRVVEQGCNAFDLGYPVVEPRMHSLMEQITRDAPGPIGAVFAAVAGQGPKSSFPRDIIRQYVQPETVIRTDNDGPCIITSMLGAADGCGMIAGTGSSLFVRKNGEIVAKIGGRGYLIDTGGSAFEIGRDGIAAAYRALDGQGEPTVLVELLEEAMGVPVLKSRSRIYDQETGGRRYIASFARVVFRGWEMGDEVCRQIIDLGAEKQAMLVRAAAKHFDGEFTVVLSGGLHLHIPAYTELIRSKCPPQAKLLRATVPPVCGGAMEAMMDLGVTPDDTTRQNFMSTYED